VVAASRVTLERATGLSGAVERLASTVGAAAAGVLVAAAGAPAALLVDAASFALSAALLAATVPAPARTEAGEARGAGYRAELADGWRFLRGDRVLLCLAAVLALTNLLDAAYATVLVPVWARETGGGAAAVGLLFALFSAFAVAGSLVAARYAERLPRLRTCTMAFLLLGLPRFAVLALDVPLGVVLGYASLSGLLCGFVNPVLGAVLFERTPDHLTGRVTALASALGWAGLPLGGLAGGLLVSGVGLQAALLLTGAAYLVVTLGPLRLPSWRALDQRPSGRGADEAAPAEEPAPAVRVPALSPARGTRS
jgi:MFS family permease